jgi:hypothetical protein
MKFRETQIVRCVEREAREDIPASHALSRGFKNRIEVDIHRA